MHLPTEFIQCVVFLGKHQEGELTKATIKPSGTGFFVAGGNVWPDEAFIVTARHVAVNLGRPFLIRVNTKTSGVGTLPVDAPDDLRWCFHEDSNVDLAVAPIRPPDWALAMALTYENITNSARLEAVGAGDQVAVVGLFHLLYGSKQNRPVVHVGHIAMMPDDDPVPVGDGETRHGYLVQANAISGCSGSPVFVSRQRTINNGGVPMLTGREPDAFVLGVWSSSWKVRDARIVSAENDLDKGLLAPLGMGIVTPIQKLVEILEGGPIKRVIAERRNKRGASLPEYG